MSAGTAILIVFGVLFFIVIISIIWAIAIYNGLVSKRELVNEGWSSIDVQLKRRFNLIKNLGSVVKPIINQRSVWDRQRSKHMNGRIIKLCCALRKQMMQRRAFSA